MSLRVPLIDWGLRDYGVAGQIGLEPTMQEFIAKMVTVFREVRRVLRYDGVCFVNLGDSYASDSKGSGGPSDKQLSNAGSRYKSVKINHGLKPKDLCGVPWRVALALQDDGWYLRSDIIWSKNNRMPESVTDRPTKSHEYIFLLTKSSRYFWDQEATREPHVREWDSHVPNGTINCRSRNAEGINCNPNGRNLRTVWTIPTQSFSGAHFATYPQKLVETCIKAGTSEWGCCPECGKQWVRVVEKVGITTTEKMKKSGSSDKRGKGGKLIVQNLDYAGSHGNNSREIKTIGWQPSCSCKYPDPIPCTVLDPFLGSGTTALVAQKMGRKWIGIELNPTYAEMAKKRIFKGGSLFHAANCL